MSSAWSPGATPPPDHDVEPGRRRPRSLATVGIGLAVAAAIGVAFVASRPDDPAADTTPAPGTSAIAPGTSELPATTAPADPVATATPAEAADDGSAPASGEDVSTATSIELAPPSAASRTVADVIAASRAPVLSVVELAPELADLAPTEIVALDFEESIVEVSIPSGRVRVTDIGFTTNGARLVTTDFGALVWPMPGGAYELLSANGERAFVEGNPPAAVAATPGLDRFYLWDAAPDGAAADGLPGWITATGDLGARQPVPANLSDVAAVLVDPFGELLDSGGGGAPADLTGTNLPSTAEVVAVGRNHVLHRECDTGGRCRLTSLDRNGFRTLYPTDLPDDAEPLRIDGLSPTGDALLLAAARSGVDDPPSLEVLELVDGTRRVLRASADSPARAAWAVDGSGVFFADVQLLYIDRSTAEAVVVSPELPKLRQPTARVPGRSAPCELLAVVMPVFDEMRTAVGPPVRPPSTELLREVLDAQPAELRRATQPLADFVASFVSIEQPESQRPANWPTDVRAGLDALDAANAAC